MLKLIEELLRQQDSIIGAIWAKHSEFCLSSDNCDCAKLVELIESAFCALEAENS